jgi:hypothetical protein
MQPGQAASAVVLSGAKVLMKTSNARFCIIESLCLSLIRMSCSTLRIFSNKVEGLAKTSSAL